MLHYFTSFNACILNVCTCLRVSVSMSLTPSSKNTEDTDWMLKLQKNLG